MKKIKKKLKTKSDIVLQLSQKLQLSKSITHQAFNILIQKMTQTLLKDQKIDIRGFGNLYVKKYASYVGQNPKSKKSFIIPAKKRPKFKLGILLKNLHK